MPFDVRRSNSGRPRVRRWGNRSYAAQAAARGREVQKAEAATFAANVLPIIESLRASGVRDLRGLAEVLNNRGVRTARGGRLHVSNVKNLVDRLVREVIF